jgi:hypothetical protein
MSAAAQLAEHESWVPTLIQFDPTKWFYGGAALVVLLLLLFVVTRFHIFDR